VAVGDFNSDGQPDLAVADDTADGRVSILLNTTPPPVTMSPAVTVSFPQPTGSNGWFSSSPVTGTVTATDRANVTNMSCTGATLSNQTGAGTSTMTGILTISVDGAWQVTCTATDGAGNRGAAPGSTDTATIKLDSIPPTVTWNAAADSCSLPGTNGWCRSTQTASFMAADATSGVASPCSAQGGASCTFAQSTVTEGGGVSISAGRVCDVAGNCSAGLSAGPYKIDHTPPVVSVTSVSDGATYTLGSVPTAGCSTADAISGVASQATVSMSGGTANDVGSFNATCTGATDNAGNTATPVTASYTVHYAFSGFFSPVSNLPVVNSVKAGSAVPLKWSVGRVSALSSAVSVQWSTVSCITLTGTSTAIDSTTTGDSTLRYDASAGQFIDNVATQAAWAGTCSQLTLTLDDGTTHRAYFSFK
jgi:hypothetical protein